MIFENREKAGKLLAERLLGYRGTSNVVLALPRGGLPVARPIADALGAPLDVMVARKLGAPDNPEFAIGAVTARGHRVLNEDALRMVFLPPGYLERETEHQAGLAAERERLLRGVRQAVPLAGKTMILVDDGIATGMTMEAALVDVRAESPAKVVVAAPVIGPEAFERLSKEAEVVTLQVPSFFYAIGQFYADFSQVSDEEAREILAASLRKH
ncbi:MAG: phosphoribosyltransferase [Bacteroidota bacterium]